MQELITITEQKGIQLVDARELHRKLKVQTSFNHWFSRRISEYNFDVNKDYFAENQLLVKNDKKVHHRPRTEYFLTIDMAKEIAMVERTEVGKIVRNYFIEIEKIARQNILHIPAPKIINGVQCISYNYWLLQNGYSLTSGQVRTRIKKYPEQFIKTKDGWYMSEAIGQYFLDYRNPQQRVEALPFVSPKQLSMFND